MAKHTEFGKQVKKALIDREQTGAWLVGQVRAQSGMYFDDAYLSKLLCGKKESERLEAVIREILGLRP
ncbi:MAG: XRE family transcriptional regulator [Oscillospiraceae bacterium]|nr:XRE family transcriptional regulator [Oscillospiraceae bacterium]